MQIIAECIWWTKVWKKMILQRGPPGQMITWLKFGPLVRAPTWWTTFLTCGASPERYGAIYQHMEPKNVFFDHFWAKIMIFTNFDRALEARARRRNFWYFFVIENDAKGRLIPNFRFPAQATTPELRCFCMDLRNKFHLWFLKNIGKISSKFPCFSWKFKIFWFSVLKMGS